MNFIRKLLAKRKRQRELDAIAEHLRLVAHSIGFDPRKQDKLRHD